jgi:hypothetical protein
MKSCSCAEDKEVCLALARDFMNLLVNMQSDPEWDNLKGAEISSCSGKETIFTILGEDKDSCRRIPGLSPADQKAAEIGEFMMLLIVGVQKEDERTDVAS